MRFSFRSARRGSRCACGGEKWGGGTVGGNRGAYALFASVRCSFRLCEAVEVVKLVEAQRE